ncbi:calponin homology domain-containing protein DDB_G0272472 [Sitophilus oryzae]|uniref:Calponin homology domain-containing protein DDB_G0272472 n=1 Tax=Sitophilus oryzae TaxID=7048 RepID=A0A6J2YLR9_SITOR|nr:calponin homology domain-containing protein DDB_G0272472 [Sitophilus oryzae]
MGTTPAEIFAKIQRDNEERMKGIMNQAQTTFYEIDKGIEEFSKYVNRLIANGGIDDEDHKVGDNLGKDKGNTRSTRGVKVKKEKLSEGYVSNTQSSTESVTSTTSSLIANIKTEKEDMPAPSFIPPKKKAKDLKLERPSRTTRTKGKKATNSEENSRDSDVVIQNSTSTIISLSDSEESDSTNSVKGIKGRSTRTKTRKANKVLEESEKESEMDSTSSTKADETSLRSTLNKTTKKGKTTEENEDVCLPPRTTRTKTIRKAQKEENNVENDDNGSKGGKTVEEKDDILVPPRTTRTKTIRKAPKEEIPTEVKKDNEEETQVPTRSTRTKTIRKAPKEDNDGLKENNKENLEKEVPADNKIVPEVTRSTRTKTRKIIGEQNEVVNNVVEAKNNGKLKRCRSESTDRDEVEKESKKKSISKSPKKEDCDSTVRTEYEDARSTMVLEPPQVKVLDATYVASENKVPALNTTVTVCSNNNKNDANRTVTVEKHKFDIFNTEASYHVSDLLTDDDSIEAKTPPKTKHGKSAKEVFSPYEKTTLKKKVEAFEKLQRPKEMASKLIPNLKSTTPSVKEKAKLFTPIGSKFLPSSSSTSKVPRMISHSSINTDSFQAMKSAQKESREKRMQEKEQALMKKEAMLHAQAEAKKKLNEEKQLKAQQQRKAIEAEKLKQIELHKQKEERLRQREQEKAEYLQKKKIEAEKQRLAQKKKIQELHAQREEFLAEQSRNPPIYMTTKPPMLPTADCYDSDDANYKKVKPPSWCSDQYARTMQLAMLAAGDKIKNTLFCRHPQTPDLKEIFQSIDPVKLKRTSSILWRKPPRYTMMPDLNETTFQEDDEIFDSD